MSLRWPNKDPDEILDYDVVWTWRLYSAVELGQAKAQLDAGDDVTIMPADTIVASTFTLSPGIIAQSSAFSTTATKVWLTGGADGEIYEIVNKITTAGGRRMDQTIKIKVKTK